MRPQPRALRAAAMNALTFSGSKRPTALPVAFSEVLTIAPSATASDLAEILGRDAAADEDRRLAHVADAPPRSICSVSG